MCSYSSLILILHSFFYRGIVEYRYINFIAKDVKHGGAKRVKISQTMQPFESA